MAKSFKRCKLIGCLMVDFRKAFDLVDHQILLKNLKSYKFSDIDLSWFSSYLFNRTQRVAINNELSDSSTVNCGVPQGSILGPLSLTLFINDLPVSLQNTISAVDLYADDTTIYDQQFIWAFLKEIYMNGTEKNGMVLNTEKTKVMLITSRQKRNNLNEVSFSLQYKDIDTGIRMTTSDKILGVYVDDNLSWNDHFHHISKKVSWSYLWLLSKIKTYLSKSIDFYITILILNKNQKWDSLRAMKTFIRKKVGHTT